MTTEPSEIVYESVAGVATLTLNRPHRLNAVTPAMLGALLAALDRADADDGVRAVVVTGAGRAFCAGAELGGEGPVMDAAGAGGAAGAPHRDGGGRVALRLYEMRKPVIAAINGPAVGFGVTMTLPMDVRIAAADARLGLVFTRRGLVPEACSTWFLPRLVGIGRALEWVATGRVLSAEEAREGGLVSRVVPAARVLPEARALAEDLARETSAVAVALARQMLWTMLGTDHPMAAHRLESRVLAWLAGSPDLCEGVAAFLEKRPPRFPMRLGRDLPPFFPWAPPREFAP